MKASLFLFVFFSCLFFGCSGSSDEAGSLNEDNVVTSPGLGIESNIISAIDITLNPSGYAPLTALINMQTTQAVAVSITVIGQQGVASTIVRTIDQQGLDFDIEVLGLYADYNNQIDISLLDASSSILETHSVNLQTDPLIPSLPDIRIDVSSSATSTEFNFVNYFGFTDSFQPQRPFIFDQFGDIRWYLDFSEHPTFPNTRLPFCRRVIPLS